MNKRSESGDPQLGAERKMNFRFETTKVDGIIYDVRELEQAAEELAIVERNLNEFEETVAEGHHYWLDTNGNTLGPCDILRDWEAAQKTSAWSEHVATIKKANFDSPIWVTKDGYVFNGLHRLTAAFLQHRPTIKIRIFDSLPSSAQVKEN